MYGSMSAEVWVTPISSLFLLDSVPFPPVNLAEPYRRKRDLT